MECMTHSHTPPTTLSLGTMWKGSIRAPSDAPDCNLRRMRVMSVCGWEQNAHPATNVAGCASAHPLAWCRLASLIGR